MRIRPSIGLLLSAILGAGGCASFDKSSEAEPAGAKTLLAWQPGPEPEKTGDDAGEVEEPSKIVTDRPDFTEASSTVGRGRVQLEAGFTYIRDSDGLFKHSYPESLLRVGLFADWFEARFGQNFSNALSHSDFGPIRTNTADDVYIGAKFGLTEQKGIYPEVALVVQSTLPTGPRAATAGKVLPGMNYLYGWDVNDFISVAGSTQGNARVDDDGGSYLQLAQSGTVGYTLTEKLGAYTEFFALFPHGATAPDTAPQYYFNGGFTYKFTDNFQYDVRAGVGLNRHSDDYFVGTGFAVRY